MLKLKNILPVFIATLLIMGGAYAVQTGGAGHSNPEVDSSGKTIAGYDVTVCSTGCDYTSIVTAFSTEGSSKSYFINGSYTVSSAMAVPSTSYVKWNNVSLTVNTGGKIDCENTVTTKMEGLVNMEIASGVNAEGQFFDTAVTSIGNDFSNFTLNITAAGPLVFSGSTNMVVMAGDNNLFGSYYIKGITIGSSEGTGTLRIINLQSTESSVENIIIDTITYTSTHATRVAGLAVEGGLNNNVKSILVKDIKSTAAIDTNGIVTVGDQGSYNCIIDGVTTDTGSAGVGILIYTGADYNCFTGISRGSDSANVTNSGTGTQDNLTS